MNSSSQSCSEVSTQIILHASITSLLQMLELLDLLRVVHILDIYLVLNRVVDKLILLLGLILHLHRNLRLEARWYLRNSCSPLLLDELEERPQSIFVLEQIFDSILMFCNKRRFHEAILGILNQFPEINHQAPWIWPKSLQSLEKNDTDLFLDVWFGFNKQSEQN